MPKKADKSGATSPGYEERLRGAPGLAEVLVILKEAATSNSDPQKKRCRVELGGQGEQSRTFFFQALSVLAQKVRSAREKAAVGRPLPQVQPASTAKWQLFNKENGF